MRAGCNGLLAEPLPYSRNPCRKRCSLANAGHSFQIRRKSLNRCRLLVLGCGGCAELYRTLRYWISMDGDLITAMH